MERVLLFFSLALWASAQIYVQPGGSGTGTSQSPYGKIQDAVDNATNGTTIILKDGIYLGVGNVNINFRAKSLTIQSATGYRNTFVSSETANFRIFTMQTGENITVDGISFINCGRSSIGVLGVSRQNIKNCYFSGNTASSGGGAILVSNGGNAIVDNCIFENNANAAVYVQNSQATISNSRFIGNTPISGDPGSGVKLAAASLGQTSVQISNTIFINNAMAVYQDQFSYLTLTNNKFYNNTATYTIQCLNSAVVTQSGNSFCGISGNTLGCGTWTPVLSPFDGCKICGGFNENKDCNGVCWGNSTNCNTQTIEIFAGVQTIQSAIDSSTGYRTNIILHPGVYTGVGNTNVFFNGKAVTISSLYVDPIDVQIICSTNVPSFTAINGESYDTVIQGVTISGCNSVIVRQGSGLSIKRSIIKNGFRTKGGGLYVEDSQVYVDGCIFFNNTAQNGGGLYLEQTNVMSWGKVNGTLFQDNVALLNGGAIFVDSLSQLVTDKNYFIHNSAGSASRGGALYATLDTGSIFVVSRSSFFNNGYNQVTQDSAYCTINNPGSVPFNVSNGNAMCGDTFSNSISCHNWTQPLVPNVDMCSVCNGGNSTADCRGECFGWATSDGFSGCCRMIERDCAGACAQNHVTFPSSATGLDICCINTTAAKNTTGNFVCCQFPQTIDQCGICGGNNQCCNQPCLNGGSCVASTCQCVGGWNGTDCSQNGAGCPQTCINGTCVAPYTCQCFDPLDESQNCAGSAPCGSIVCINGGFCDNLACNCSGTGGYSGTTCATPVCSPPCQNGGNCIVPGTCDCPVGRNGSRCEEFFCYPICQNGGTCTGPSTCNCPSNYSGPRCNDYTPEQESISSRMIIYFFTFACLALFAL